MVNEPAVSPPPNGAGAAAVLSAAIGGFTLGVFALVGDAFSGVAHVLSVWHPTGPLSGVTAIAIIVWLIVWFALSRLWARRSVELRRINLLAAALLIAALLLTFPPFMDLLQGK